MFDKLLWALTASKLGESSHEYRRVVDAPLALPWHHLRRLNLGAISIQLGMILSSFLFSFFLSLLSLLYIIVDIIVTLFWWSFLGWNLGCCWTMMAMITIYVWLLMCIGFVHNWWWCFWSYRHVLFISSIWWGCALSCVIGLKICVVTMVLSHLFSFFYFHFQ